MPKIQQKKPSYFVITNWRDMRHPQAGGAEVVCEELATRISKADCEVVLLTSRVEGLPSREVSKGFTTIHGGGRYSVYAHALFWLLLHRKRIDAVIDSQNGIPFFTPLVLSRDCVVILLLHHIHQHQFKMYFSPAAAMVGRWLERVGSQWVYGERSVVTVSPSTRTGARRDLHLKGNLFVVPPGITQCDIDDPLRRKRSNHPSIVCVGRLVPHKRIDTIIKAMPRLTAQLPDIQLHIIGTGQDALALRHLVETLGMTENISIHEGFKNEERDEMLSTAWLTVNTSEGEGWGLSVIEANALGVPALAYRRPGLRDSIWHGVTGWLLEEDSCLEESILQALKELADMDYAQQIAEKTREWAGRFTWDNMAQQILKVVEAERDRLRLEHMDRRLRSDLAMVVDIAISDLPYLWAPAFRDTDRYHFGQEVLSIFFYGADSISITTALERLGLSHIKPIDIRIARTRDRLQQFSEVRKIND